LSNWEYTGRINPLAEGWKSSPWTDLLKERHHLVSLMCKDKAVLDSCCGTGWGTLKYIAPVASYVVGVDICQPNAYLPARDNWLFHSGDARNLSYPDNTFDIVLALDSLEHFTQENGLQYLQEINRVCRSDGLVIGTTPLVPFKSLIPHYLNQNKYHRNMFIPDSLKDTLTSVFSVVSIHKIYNRVCPYMVFICGISETSETAHIDAEEKLIEFRKTLNCYTQIETVWLWIKLYGKNLLRRHDG